MTRLARSIATALGLVGLLGACGDPSEMTEVASGEGGWPAQDEYTPPECPGEHLAGNPSAEKIFFPGSGTWVAVPAGAESLAGTVTLHEVSPETTVLIAGGGGQNISTRTLTDLNREEIAWPPGIEEASGSEAMLAMAEREMGRGAELRMKVRHGDEEDIAAGSTWAEIDFVGSLRPDGSVMQIWNCGPVRVEDMADLLDAVVGNGRAANHAEALRLLTDAEDPTAAYAELSALVPTTAEPAEDREQDASTEPMWVFAPPEERANTHPVDLAVVIPDEWIGLDLAICTRTPRAWSTCVYMKGGLYSDGVESMITFLDPPDPVEVWLVDPSNDYESIAELASFPAAEIDRLTNPEVTLELPAGAEGRSRQAAVAAATAGRVAAELAEGVRILENNTDLPPEYAPLTITVPDEPRD